MRRLSFRGCQRETASPRPVLTSSAPRSECSAEYKCLVRPVFGADPREGRGNLEDTWHTTGTNKGCRGTRYCVHFSLLHKYRPQPPRRQIGWSRLHWACSRRPLWEPDMEMGPGFVFGRPRRVPVINGDSVQLSRSMASSSWMAGAGRKAS